MRRILAVTFLLAAAAAYVLTASAAKEESGSRFTVELDNAFGLVVGGDVKVAGVRAGKVTKMDVDRKSQRALVDFELTKQGFGSLRSDVFCETRPQSLIGEYFIDCRPGTSAKKLPSGGRIPVTQTASTIPADLLNNVLRLPYRERLRIILNELGAGVGGRAEDLNAAIRRGSPALRETDRVLALLARQNTVLKNLVTDADVVVGDLAGNRKNVGRWVRETEDAATASAERRRDIAGGLRRLPGFLRELRPTMTELGRTADASTPYLANLNASAGQLERFLENLGPFAESSRVNIRTLAQAADVGRPAVRSARPTVAELARTTEKLPELANNLTYVLKDLDDRERAVEPDPRSPGGKGYTGFEAVLSWIFDNTMAINIFDENGHILKVNLSASECSEYQNADSLKEQEKKSPGFYKRCASILGPNQPGVTTPDPTKTGNNQERAEQGASPLPAGAQAASRRSRTSASKPSSRSVRSSAPAATNPLQQVMQQLMGPGASGAQGAPAPAPSAAAPNSSAGGGSSDPGPLLDYLLAP